MLTWKRSYSHVANMSHARSESEAQIAREQQWMGQVRKCRGRWRPRCGDVTATGAVADPRLPPGGGSATAQSRPGPGLTRQTPELQLRKPAQAQKTPNLNWKKKNWGEKANSLPSDSLYCDKDVNLNHKLLSLFHQLLCQNRTASHSWGSKLRTIILDLASDRGNKANTYFLLIDEEIWYWKVHVIKH